MGSRRRKPACFSVLAAVLASAALAAGAWASLGVLPHAHDGDWAHAAHAACPIHQAGLHGPQAAPDGIPELLPAFTFLRTLTPRIDRLPVVPPQESYQTRAPPPAA